MCVFWSLRWKTTWKRWLNNSLRSFAQCFCVVYVSQVRNLAVQRFGSWCCSSIMDVTYVELKKCTLEFVFSCCSNNFFRLQCAMQSNEFFFHCTVFKLQKKSRFFCFFCSSKTFKEWNCVFKARNSNLGKQLFVCAQWVNNTARLRRFLLKELLTILEARQKQCCISLLQT